MEHSNQTIVKSNLDQVFERLCSFRVLAFLNFNDVTQLLILNKTTNKCIHQYLQQELIKVDPSLHDDIMKFSKKDVLYKYGIYYGKTILKFSMEDICNTIYPKSNMESMRKLSNRSQNEQLEPIKETKKCKKGGKRKNTIDSFDEPETKGGNLIENEDNLELDNYNKKQKGGFYKDKKQKKKGNKNEKPNKEPNAIEEIVTQKPQNFELIPEKLNCCKGKPIVNTIFTKDYIILHDAFNEVYILDTDTNKVLVNLHGVKKIAYQSNLIWLNEANELFAANGFGNINQYNFEFNGGCHLIANNVEEMFPNYNYVVFSYRRKAGEEVTSQKRYYFLRNFGKNPIEKTQSEEIKKIDTQFFEIENDKIKQIVTGMSNYSDKNSVLKCFVDFYILSTSQKMYKGVFHEFDNNGYIKLEKLTLEEWDFFKDKKVKEIWSNTSSYIAQEDTIIPAFKDWDNKRLTQWFVDIKLDKYMNIIRSTKATGKRIIEATEEWYEDNLGLDDISEIVHINTEINKVRNITYSDPVLYGWGLNQEKQLGINTGTKEVKTPYKFELKVIDFLNNNDYVEFVNINKIASFIITKNRRFFLSTFKNFDRDNNVMKPKDHQNQLSVEKGHKKAPSNMFWMEVTDFFKNHHLDPYQIYDAKSTKEALYFLCYNTRVFSKKKFTKLPDAKTAWDRIIWDKRLNKNIVDDLQNPDTELYSQVEKNLHVKVNNSGKVEFEIQGDFKLESQKFDNNDYLLAVKGTQWDIDEITYRMFMEGSDERTWDSIKYIRHQPTGRIIWHRKAKLWIVDDLLELNEI